MGVGNVDSQGVSLMEATREALMKSIDLCGPGVKISELGEFIE